MFFNTKRCFLHQDSKLTHLLDDMNDILPINNNILPVSGAKHEEFNPDEYQKFKYHRHVQKSHVPTSPTIEQQ